VKLRGVRKRLTRDMTWRRDGCTRAVVLLAAVAMLVTSDLVAAESGTRMADALRGELTKVVVQTGDAPGGRDLTGSYEKQTKGLGGGMAAGSEIGKGVGMDVDGIPVNIPFPILTLPGAILGGIAGLTEKEIQDFRDALTKDLARQSSQPLSNQALASDVFWGLRRFADVEPTILEPEASAPAGTDAVIYVSLTGMSIDAREDEAVIRTSARVSVQRVTDGAVVYAREVAYEDRDDLKAWVGNDYALWHEYTNYARHYLGREIVALLYGRIELGIDPRPEKSVDVALVKRDPWQAKSETLLPTLAWGLGESGTGDLDVRWDLEIYDAHRPVYKATDLVGSTHGVGQALPGCGTYRWSVRPVFDFGTETRFGEWMRDAAAVPAGNGNVGSRASAGPAYTQGFATLTIKCGR